MKPNTIILGLSRIGSVLLSFILLVSSYSILNGDGLFSPLSIAGAFFIYLIPSIYFSWVYKFN